MSRLLDTDGDDGSRCTYEVAPYIKCIRVDEHTGQHFFLLPESFFELTDEGRTLPQED